MSNGYSPYVVSDLRNLPGQIEQEKLSKEKESRSETIKQKRNLVKSLKEQLEEKQAKMKKAQKGGSWFSNLFRGELGELFENIGITGLVEDLDKGLFKSPIMRSLIMGPWGSLAYDVLASTGEQMGISKQQEALQDQLGFEGLGGTFLGEDVEDYEKQFKKATKPGDAGDWLKSAIIPAVGSWALGQALGGQSIFKDVAGEGIGKQIGQNVLQAIKPREVIKRYKSPDMKKFTKLASGLGVMNKEQQDLLTSLISPKEETEEIKAKTYPISATVKY